MPIQKQVKTEPLEHLSAEQWTALFVPIIQGMLTELEQEVGRERALWLAEQALDSVPLPSPEPQKSLTYPAPDLIPWLAVHGTPAVRLLIRALIARG